MSDFECFGCPRDEASRKHVECDMMALISIGEGCCVQIIEGNATGQPVIASSQWPTSDGAKQAPCLVGTVDIEGVSNAMLKIDQREASWARRISASFCNAIRSSASIASRGYLEFCREVAAS